MKCFEPRRNIISGTIFIRWIPEPEAQNLRKWYFRTYKYNYKYNTYKYNLLHVNVVSVNFGTRIQKISRRY